MLPEVRVLRRPAAALLLAAALIAGNCAKKKAVPAAAPGPTHQHGTPSIWYTPLVTKPPRHVTPARGVAPPAQAPSSLGNVPSPVPTEGG